MIKHVEEKLNVAGGVGGGGRVCGDGGGDGGGGGGDGDAGDGVGDDGAIST